MEGVSLNWNFQRGRGSKAKNPSWEEYGYFLEQHIASVCFPGILGCKLPFDL